MSTNRLRAGIALIAALFSTASIACGVCIEDRVAAVFDSAAVSAAVAKNRHLGFFGIEGALPATAESRKAIVEALYASGGIKGTARVSLESASCSVAFDPRRTTLASLRASAEQRLASRGLTITAFRLIDQTGVLREAVAAAR